MRGLIVRSYCTRLGSDPDANHDSNRKDEFPCDLRSNCFQ